MGSHGVVSRRGVTVYLTPTLAPFHAQGSRHSIEKAPSMRKSLRGSLSAGGSSANLEHFARGGPSTGSDERVAAALQVTKGR